MDEFCPQKGVEHAFGHIGDSLDSVASGIYHWLHDGWGYSYPAGHCHHCVSGLTYSGTKNIVAIWPLAGEGEVSGKKGGKQVQKDFAKACYTVRRKGLAMNHFTIPGWSTAAAVDPNPGFLRDPFGRLVKSSKNNSNNNKRRTYK